MTKRATPLTIILITLIFLIGGCTLSNGKRNGWKHATPKRAHFEHIVRWPGETLQIIAAWYTGDSKNWLFLADANPHIDSHNVLTGSIIYVPETLLKERKSLPKAFVASYYAKPKTQTEVKKEKKPSSPSRPQEKDDFELFGPK